MTAPARLLALRLQGFKSFAERTVVEFGPGISAIVGPNGSGKSNLADALRWSLGEQGRALRSRKSEDVIFAGSEKRAALGMADVTLVLDNGDGLLPVDFSVLELGRRLYRSGENDYLLNKQRIRLRDLVDLLDGAHLADNAFLFIGQGMVDQALALRPEERRPLFEEVAGVRRHERRRRKAEEQLAESETNLARVEDILAELRPQARRLAAQAEQQTTRLIGRRGARVARCSPPPTSAGTRPRRRGRRGGAGSSASGPRPTGRWPTSQAAEEAAAAVAAEIGRARGHRARAPARPTRPRAAPSPELRLREARLAGDLEAIGRDRARLARRARGRRGVARGPAPRPRDPDPARDHELDASLAEAERLLAEANGELGVAPCREPGPGRGGGRDPARRGGPPGRGRDRAAPAGRGRPPPRGRASAAAGEVTARRDRARGATGRRPRRARGRDDRRRRPPRRPGRPPEPPRPRRTPDAGRAAERAVRGRSRRSPRTRPGSRPSTPGSARTRSAGSPVPRGDAAAGGSTRSWSSSRPPRPPSRPPWTSSPGRTSSMQAAAGALGGERGMLVVREQRRASGRRLGSAAPTDARTRRFLDRVASRRWRAPRRCDPARSERRRRAASSARTVVVDDLAAALALQPELPRRLVDRHPRRRGRRRPSWRSVSAAAMRPLERRAEADRLRAEVARLRTEADAAVAEAAEAERAATAARERRSTRRRPRRLAPTADRRRAEEAERAAARELEAVVREAGWHAAQLERLAADVERAREAVAAHEAAGLWGAGPSLARPRPPTRRRPAEPDEAAAIATWERARAGPPRAA